MAEKSVILLGLKYGAVPEEDRFVSVAEKSVILLGPCRAAPKYLSDMFQWLKSLLYCWDDRGLTLTYP